VDIANGGVHASAVVAKMNCAQPHAWVEVDVLGLRFWNKNTQKQGEKDKDVFHDAVCLVKN
jgi:hypothetical protein